MMGKGPLHISDQDAEVIAEWAHKSFFKAKVNEVTLATEVEHTFTKDEIIASIKQGKGQLYGRALVLI
jgi:hypothetical protein